LAVLERKKQTETNEGKGVKSKVGRGPELGGEGRGGPGA